MTRRLRSYGSNKEIGDSFSLYVNRRVECRGQPPSALTLRALDSRCPHLAEWFGPIESDQFI